MRLLIAFGRRVQHSVFCQTRLALAFIFEEHTVLSEPIVCVTVEVTKSDVEGRLGKSVDDAVWRQFINEASSLLASESPDDDTALFRDARGRATPSCTSSLPSEVQRMRDDAIRAGDEMLAIVQEFDARACTFPIANMLFDTTIPTVPHESQRDTGGWRRSVSHRWGVRDGSVLRFETLATRSTGGTVRSAPTTGPRDQPVPVPFDLSGPSPDIIRCIEQEEDPSIPGSRRLMPPA